MIDINEINEEINKLENCKNVTYNICSKLADLYIVRDHLQQQGSLMEARPVMNMMDSQRKNTSPMSM